SDCSSQAPFPERWRRPSRHQPYLTGWRTGHFRTRLAGAGARSTRSNPKAHPDEQRRLSRWSAGLQWAAMAKLTFLGAAGCVTGSKYLVEAAGKRLLVDCGIFQGLPELSARNYQPLPVDPSTIHYGVLTHAHLDHTGWLPRLVKTGYSGPIY